MSDAVVENRLQVESAGGFTEQAQQNIFETHASHYITCYINCNNSFEGARVRVDVFPIGFEDRVLIPRLGNSAASKIIIKYYD